MAQDSKRKRRERRVRRERTLAYRAADTAVKQRNYLRSLLTRATEARAFAAAWQQGVVVE